MTKKIDPFSLGLSEQLPPVSRTTAGQEYESGKFHHPGGLRLGGLNQRGYRRIMFTGMVFVFAILIARLLYLQTVRGGTYRALADQNAIRRVVIPAPRGNIIDRHGQSLVINVPAFALTVTPADLPVDSGARQSFLGQLAVLAGIDQVQIEVALGDRQYRRTDSIPIVENISYERAIQLMITTAELPGVAIKAVPTRTYPLGPAAAHLVGYVGKISAAELADQPQATILDITGKSGLEHSYNQTLTGRNGYRFIERDVANRQRQTLQAREPEPGQTIQVSIDAELQKRLVTRLAAAVKSAKSPGGAAVALDPATGQVLALVSIPTFDNNWFAGAGHAAERQAVLIDKNKPLLNRAVAGQYPSGSIIKPFIGLGALAERIVTPQTTVMSVGGFRVGQDEFPDWKPSGHGLTNLAKAIAESVNTYFYAIGGGYQRQRGLGVDQIVKYLQAFGWGQPLGLDMAGESPGFLPTKDWRQRQRPSPWKLGDTYHLAIGQGDVAVTPLQVAASLAAIANGGTLYQPYLVTAIADPNGQTIKKINPRQIRSAIASRQVISAIQVGLRQGVLTGSSRALQTLPVSAAGKTGTAQFGRQGKTHAWFAVYAPAERARIVMAVIIESGGEGNETALPVARDILQWYFTRSSE